MKETLLLFPLSFLVQIGYTELVQWEVEDGGNDHWYEAISVSEDITWSQAKLEAELRGGHLVCINSEEENLFVYSLFANNPEFGQPLGEEGLLHGPWIGGLRLDGSPQVPESWQWVNGDPFEYTAWDRWEPNYSDAANRIHYHHLTYEFWNDIDGTIPLAGYIVEIPKPATLLLLGMGGLLIRKQKL